jgi:tryptophanyl-tRNA synthetase
MIRHVIADLAPMAERRQALEAKAGLVEEILEAGQQQARSVAEETMVEVREAVGLSE